MKGREMLYNKIIVLKDGRKCCLRNGTEQDGQEALDNFLEVHEQTDFLMSYPDENTFTAEDEGKFLREKTDSEDAVELAAIVDGKLVGLAAIEPVGAKSKVKRRALFGISIDKGYWGLGIGKEMMHACIECAKKAGYSQLELDVVAENERAVELYRKMGFVEYGRNPRGFFSRFTGWQELILMRLELD